MERQLQDTDDLINDDIIDDNLIDNNLIDDFMQIQSVLASALVANLVAEDGSIEVRSVESSSHISECAALFTRVSLQKGIWGITSPLLYQSFSMKVLSYQVGILTD